MSDAEPQRSGHGEALHPAVHAGADIDAIVRDFSTRVQQLEQELRAVRGILEAADAGPDVREPTDVR